jgi:hypothetical protein
MENKINWKKVLKNFKSINAKIFYILFYLEENGLIKSDQKKFLKKLAMCYNKEIFDVYKKFVDDNYNIYDLTDNLLNIYNNQTINDDNISILHRAAITAFNTPIQFNIDKKKKKKSD